MNDAPFFQDKLIRISLSLILLTFIVLVLLLNIYTIYFGADVIDGPFYIALPYRFLFGAKPFVDEYNLTSGFGLLTYPFIKLYYYLYGTEGILLSFRYLYLLFSCISAAVVYLSLREVLSWYNAALIASLLLVFIPFNLPLLSYNSIAMQCLVMGHFLLFKTSICNNSSSTKKIVTLFSGVSIAISMVAYPTLFLMTPLYLMIVFYAFKANKTIIFYYALGMLLGSGWYIGVLFNVGFEQISFLLEWTASLKAQLGGSKKMISVVNLYWDDFHYKYLIIFFTATALIVKQYKPHVITFINSYICLGMLLIVYDDSLSIYLRNIGSLAPFLFFLAPSEIQSKFKKLFLLAWTPGFIGGIIVSYSSSNSATASFIAGLSCTLVSLCFAAIFSQENISLNKIRITSYVNYMLFFFSVSGLMCYIEYEHIKNHYGDKQTQYLNFKIPEGPYKGIYTTYENGQYILDIQTELKKLEGNIDQEKKRILFFDDFPLGYLLGNFIPHTNTAWLFSLSTYPTFDRQATINYFEKNGYPDIIVHKSDVNYSNSLPKDPLLDLLEQYKLYKKETRYSIYLNNKHKIAHP